MYKIAKTGKLPAVPEGKKTWQKENPTEQEGTGQQMKQILPSPRAMERVWRTQKRLSATFGIVYAGSSLLLPI